MVKPAVSAGGRSSGRFDADEEAAALDLVRTIHGDGRTAMVQPYLPDGHGEIALVYSGGGYSHSLARSAALPRGGAEAVLYLEETLGPREASEAERAVGDAAMACAPGGADLLYGRVDLLHDAYGEPLVLELELAEPSLYLAFGAGSAERFADAIAASL